MKILAIETATEACSAALAIDDTVIERHRIAPREHAALLLPMVEELLAEAGLALQQLDGLAFGCGPGSFTGVRIATSVAQGLAFGADLPVVPVSTLAALAQGAWREFGVPQVAAAIDARMQEIYCGLYRERDGLMEVAVADGLYAPEAAPDLPDGQWFGVGSGWEAYASALQQRYGNRLAGTAPQRFPHAQDVAVLAIPRCAAGETLAAEQALPVYLRDRVTHQRAAAS